MNGAVDGARLLLLAAPTVPVLLALLLALRGRARERVLALAPWAAVPALVLALLPAAPPPAPVPALLLDSWLGLDTVSRVFLLFTALLWTIAGWYARGYLAADAHRARYWVFHLLALTGNLGLCVAHDLASFYLAFAVMTFAGYGLVVHEPGAAPRRAGRVYVVMAVGGEVLLLAGLMLAATGAASLELAVTAEAVAASPYRNTIIALLLAGFGIKAGALPLHVWLPLAHPVAPTPASAVLSGSMIKAGLLGWVRFLPLGLVSLPGWGAALIVLGLLAAFGGAALGVMQREAKTTLAYSSISQMGLVNVAVGAGLAAPQAWPSVLAAILAYAVHHGLAKGALFLGVGVAAAEPRGARRRLALAGLALAGLAVAGAPLTSGAVAKYYLKDLTAFAPGAWPARLDLLLPLVAIGSTLLMARVLWLAAHASEPAHAARGLWAPWLALLAAVGVVVWALPGYYELEVAPPALPSPGSVWVSVWPVAGGVLLAWLVAGLARRRPAHAARLYVPAGDLLLPLERTIAALGRRIRPEAQSVPARPVVSLGSFWYGIYARPRSAQLLLRAERAITRWPAAVALTVLVALGIALSLAGGGPR